MNKHKRQAAAALDYVYKTYQVDRDELEAIATLKAIDPETDIIALCNVFTDVARDAQRDAQAAQHAEPPICAECAERAAIRGLINAVMQAVIDGVPFAIIESVMKDVLQ